MRFWPLLIVAVWLSYVPLSLGNILCANRLLGATGKSPSGSTKYPIHPRASHPSGEGVLSASDFLARDLVAVTDVDQIREGDLVRYLSSQGGAQVFRAHVDPQSHAINFTNAFRTEAGGSEQKISRNDLVTLINDESRRENPRFSIERSARADSLIAARRSPELGGQDTRIGNNQSAHGDGHIFISDGEILDVDVPAATYVDSQSRLSIDRLADGRHVFVQPGMRACTDAAAAMLILDNGATPNWPQVTESNLGTTATIVDHIRSSGLSPKVKLVGDRAGLADYKTLPIDHGVRPERHTVKGPDQAYVQLALEIEKDGPAILSVDGEIGGHVIIVDRVNLAKETAVIRDPYHGWSITVPLSSVRARVDDPLTFIQVGK